MRRVIAALIVVGLAAGLWYLWPRSADEDPPPPDAQGSTTTTSAPDLTTTIPAPTSTSAGGSNVVETVAEAEEILRELWFGWFEGIYNQDEDRIREVVVLEATVATARQSFGTEFERAPMPEDITFEGSELLRSDEDCLVVWTELVLAGFRQGRSLGVEVIRWTGEGWKSLSVWTERDDLWEADCDSSL
jgi:hypothetical protein